MIIIGFKVNLDLFSSQLVGDIQQTEICRHAWLLHGFALPCEHDYKRCLQEILKLAPLRQMRTPAGQLMQVSMSNCGRYGWVSDEKGYRYLEYDPMTGEAWPQMPASFYQLAKRAAKQVGYTHFSPDACLINCYRPGVRLSLHQDKDEEDLTQPIVSVSLGLPATFLFGGLERSATKTRIGLNHGDVVVWGGDSRLAYHGIQPIPQGKHSLFSACRINLTFRKAKKCQL